MSESVDISPETSNDDTDLDLRVDFTDVQTRPEPIPAGWYHARITQTELRRVANGDNKGKPYIWFEFTIQGGQYEGRHVWTNGMLFGNALFTVKGILEALGEDGSFSAAEIMDLVDQKELQIKVSVKPETPQYEASNDIRRYKSLQESSSTASQAESLLP